MAPVDCQLTTLTILPAVLAYMEPRDLSAHDIYIPGAGLTEVARELGREPDELVALASNENPYGPSPAAINAITDGAGTVDAYPKSSHTDLMEKLAEHWQLESDQVWLSPGADGAIDYLTRAMLTPGDRILVPDPGFSYYAMSGRYHHGQVDTYHLSKRDDFDITSASVLDSYANHRMVFITSPHNPTGSVASLETVRQVARETDDQTLIVVDEAYGEFADRPSARQLLDDREDVAVLRTFSKAYGLAGVRVGYALVPSGWAEAYTKINTPFAVNELACRAASAALDDTDHVDQTITGTRKARKQYQSRIDAHTWDSHGNFVLVDVGDAAAVTEALKQRGVIVRDCSSFGLPGCIRITCGTNAETDRAITALNEVLAAKR